MLSWIFDRNTTYISVNKWANRRRPLALALSRNARAGTIRKLARGVYDLRDGSVLEAGSDRPRARSRSAQPQGVEAIATELRPNDAEPDLRREGGEPGLRRVDEGNFELAFAERILPCASDLWVQKSLDYEQRLQQLFFPEGIAYDGNRFNRAAATAPLFNYLAPSDSADEKMANPNLNTSRIFVSWNQLDGWLRQIEALRHAA